MELTRNRAMELIHSTAIELYSKMRELEENYRSNPSSVGHQILEITKYSNDMKDVIERMNIFNEFTYLDNEGLETFLGLCRKVAQKFSLKIEPELPEGFTVVELFTVDGDVIYCHDVAGLRDAAEYCKKNPQIKKIVVEKDGKGIRLTFNSAEAAKEFLKSETIKTLESIFSKISDGVGILTIIDDSKFIDVIGKMFTFTSAAIDGKNIPFELMGKKYSKLLDSASDVIIDLLGFAGTPGAVASLQLKYTKQGVIFAAEQLAQLNKKIENYFFDMCMRFPLLGGK